MTNPQAPAEERLRVQAQFLDLMGDSPDTKIAEILEVDLKTVKRLRTQKHAPNHKNYRRMVKHIEEISSYAQMSLTERQEAQDRARAHREERQRNIPLSIRNRENHKDIVYPSFIKTAIQRVKEGNYDNVIDILRDRLEEPDETKHIEKAVLPYAFQLLGIAYHYTGRITESIEAYKKAIQHGLSIGLKDSSYFIKSCWSTIAIAHIRLHAFDKAFEAIERAISSHPRNFAAAYYNGLCIATAARDIKKLAEWMGRSKESAESSWLIEDVSEFIERAGQDDDLKWARQQDIWEEFIKDLNELHLSMSRQTSHNHQSKDQLN